MEYCDCGSLDKVLEITKIILGHSAEDWRHKVEKETSPTQPFWKHIFTIHLDWTISIKYFSPIALSLILGYNIIDEIVHPYGFEQHGYSAIVFSIIPMIFVCIIIGMAIIPCGTFSWSDVRQKISGIKNVKNQFEPKPVPEGITSEELQDVDDHPHGINESLENEQKNSTEQFEDARNELEGLGNEFEKRLKKEENQASEISQQKLDEVQIE